jgi:4-hydroxybenzoate polyprenyltransferase
MSLGTGRKNHEISVKKYLEFVRFSHTVFALPFALAAMFVAGWPGWGKFGLILAAMVCARTAAMGFNRIVDQKYDAANPRTKMRHLPSGKIGRREAWTLVAVSAAGLVVVSGFINRLCFILSPVALVVVCFYSLTKRFTHWTHVFLGLALGLAPVGAWLAVTGAWAWPPVVLAGAVVFWLVGFDIIYATQDVEFDRQAGLHSLPVKWGIAGSLQVAAGAHLLMAGLLVGFGLLSGLGLPYYAGLSVILVCLIGQHFLARQQDPVSLNVAFFRMNAIISVVFLVAVMTDVLWTKAPRMDTQGHDRNRENSCEFVAEKI